MAQLATFDTYKLVKRLESKGADTGLAEEIIDAIQQGRMIELSALVSKTDFYNFRDEFYAFKDEFHEFKEEVYSFREETKERFSKLENEIVLIRKELESNKKELKKDLENNKSELKKDIATLNDKIETTKQELKTEIALRISESQSKIVMYMLSLFSPIYIGILFVLVR